MRKTDVTPVDLRITMDGKTACVTLGHAARVAVVDVRTRKVQGYILVGKRSWGLGMSRTRRPSMSPTGSVTTSPIMDRKTRKAMRSIPLDRIPPGVVIDD
jgi:hypothetical protein